MVEPIDAQSTISTETNPIEPNSLPPDIDYHALENLFPAVRAMNAYDQKSPFHHLALDEHTQEVDAQLQVNPYIQELDPRTRLILSLAAKLHDIGKPNSAVENPRRPGTNTYIGHEQRSAEMTDEILLKFNLTDSERLWIKDVVGLHARSLNIANTFSQNDQPGGKQLGAYDRFIQELEQMPGSDTQAGLKRNFRIMIAFTRSDIKATANDKIRTEKPDVTQENNTAVVNMDKLDLAVPAILQAVTARRSGTQNGAIVRDDNNAYKYVAS